jgi:hypothetical protein
MTTKFPCTLCGSRDWPTTDTDCELCFGNPDEDVIDLRPDRHEDDLDESPQ